MNIRSLTRGDGVVIAAAVLLFIASFLDLYSVDGAPDSLDFPSLWASGPVLLGVVLAGIIGAALIVITRGLPQAPKVAGLDLGQFGIAFTVFAAWSALGNIFDVAGGADNFEGSGDGPDAGTGLILALVATLVMAAAAVATPGPGPQGRPPSAPGPAAPQPYGAQPPAGYGYPGAQQPAAFGGQPAPGQQPYPGAQPAAPGQPAAPRPGTSRRSGSPCRCPGRCSRRTARPRRSPNWPPVPGTWRSSSAALRSSRRPRTAVAASFRTPRESSAADRAQPRPFVTAPRPCGRGPLSSCRTAPGA
ncbi:hypothetical protein SHKM778_74380 [Streptomyces sp. KM77-8]|uniref:Integral membrane protein n=1 Tax=Streptomyces haneummycinicus TaxID=3074435 RepID=A0AAT9HUJ7_9ACTN